MTSQKNVTMFVLLGSGDMQNFLATLCENRPPDKTGRGPVEAEGWMFAPSGIVFFRASARRAGVWRALQRTRFSRPTHDGNAEGFRNASHAPENRAYGKIPEMRKTLGASNARLWRAKPARIMAGIRDSLRSEPSSHSWATAPQIPWRNSRRPRALFRVSSTGGPG